VWGATYYVDQTGGLDTNVGTATDNAWKTIAKVNDNTFAAGDFILFKKGETWAETLTVPSSGADGNPITFGVYGTGANPVIDGGSTRASCVDFNEKNYVVVEKLKLTGATAQNVLLDGNSTVRYCLIVTGDADGVLLNSADGKIYNSTIYGNGDVGVQIGDNGVVTNSIIWGNTTNDFSAETAIVTYSIVQDAHTGTGNVASDPLFVTAGTDFTLNAFSPAINAGTDLSLTTDYVGRSVVWLPDIGAYEAYLGAYLTHCMASFFTKTADETLMDAMYRWFAARGFATGGINQRWAEYLLDAGYSQNFPESQRLYFEAQTGTTGHQAAEKKFYCQ
jgi:hypothetical protein